MGRTCLGWADPQQNGAPASRLIGWSVVGRSFNRCSHLYNGHSTGTYTQEERGLNKAIDVRTDAVKCFCTHNIVAGCCPLGRAQGTFGQEKGWAEAHRGRGLFWSPSARLPFCLPYRSLAARGCSASCPCPELGFCAFLRRGGYTQRNPLLPLGPHQRLPLPGGQVIAPPVPLTATCNLMAALGLLGQLVVARWPPRLSRWGSSKETRVASPLCLIAYYRQQPLT